MTTAVKSSTGVPSKIADELRSMIARGTLSPGMRLGQTELATQFNASRVPVREALKLLSSEGIVEHDPNRGFFVTRLSRDEAEQLFRQRLDQTRYRDGPSSRSFQIQAASVKSARPSSKSAGPSA